MARILMTLSDLEGNVCCLIPIPRKIYLRYVYTWIRKRTWLVITTILSKLKDFHGLRQWRTLEVW